MPKTKQKTAAMTWGEWFSGSMRWVSENPGTTVMLGFALLGNLYQVSADAANVNVDPSPSSTGFSSASTLNACVKFPIRYGAPLAKSHTILLAEDHTERDATIACLEALSPEGEHTVLVESVRKGDIVDCSLQNIPEKKGRQCIGWDETTPEKILDARHNEIECNIYKMLKNLYDQYLEENATEPSFDEYVDMFREELDRKLANAKQLIGRDFTPVDIAYAKSGPLFNYDWFFQATKISKEFQKKSHELGSYAKLFKHFEHLDQPTQLTHDLFFAMTPEVKKQENLRTDAMIETMEHHRSHKKTPLYVIAGSNHLDPKLDWRGAKVSQYLSKFADKNPYTLLIMEEPKSDKPRGIIEKTQQEKAKQKKRL